MYVIHCSLSNAPTSVLSFWFPRPGVNVSERWMRERSSGEQPSAFNPGAAGVDALWKESAGGWDGGLMLNVSVSLSVKM